MKGAKKKMNDLKRHYFNIESAIDNADETYNIIMAARGSGYNRRNIMNDLINRHAAFDALDGAAENWNIAEPYHEGIRAGLRQASRIIMNLPSAEPEIIYCKDCVHGVDYYHEGDCYCSNPKWGLKYFGGSWVFYCADAERRTE